MNNPVIIGPKKTLNNSFNRKKRKGNTILGEVKNMRGLF